MNLKKLKTQTVRQKYIKNLNKLWTDKFKDIMESNLGFAKNREKKKMNYNKIYLNLQNL